MRIDIKPLSVNRCWQGRRFKTPEYKAYETELLYKLPKLKVGKEKLKLTIIVGFSNKKSDLDNICKPFQDIIQRAYSFDDSQIYKLIMTKEIVPKGKEYIDFEIGIIK